jgi:hypothetical protein
MTTRIYYTEPYRRTFDATVLSVRSVDGKLHVTLDPDRVLPHLRRTGRLIPAPSAALR